MYAPTYKKLRKNTVSQGLAPHSNTLTGNSGPVSVFFVSGELTGKERDPETGLYYYGARYLDPRTSRWISADPAMWEGDYIPSAPINDQARERNQNLPGMGGIFNYVNFHVYHYGGNNPIKLVDPDGRNDELNDLRTMLYNAIAFIQRNASTNEEKALATRLTEMMNEGRVQFDDVTRRYETPQHPGHIRDTTGFFDPFENTVTGQARNIIVIDIENTKNRGLGQLIRTLAHEGYHALQFSRGEIAVNSSNIRTYEQLADIEESAYRMGAQMYNKYAEQNGMRPIVAPTRDQILNSLNNRRR